MSFGSQRTALAGTSAERHSPIVGRAARAPRAVPRERPQRRTLSAAREILAFLATGGSEGHAAGRYRL